VVVEFGLTTILEEVEPFPHRKLVAPLAVNVAEAPAQMEEAEALIFTPGAALTFTVTLAILMQPLALVPVHA
jgi:hypothetical protein